MEDNKLQDLIKQKIENLRPKLLDLSRRNPLISTRFTARSNAHIRVVDELPDVLSHKLNNGQKMRLVPLPGTDDDPKDEEAKEFQDALANARITDKDYLARLESVERDADDYLDRTRAIERELKDRLRAELGMPERQCKAEINLAQHARNNGITPSYELPDPNSEHEDGRHTDDDIQTLLLPNDLERKLNNLASKCRTWREETGINVLHIAYGFVEWSEPNQTDTSFAPILLAPASIEKRRSRDGVEFWISGAGDEAEVNAVLIEKLLKDFGLELPEFVGPSVESYLTLISQLAPKHITWRVRRQVAIGVFPSARMAMYHDLNTADTALCDNEIVNALLGGTNTETSSPFGDEYNVDDPDVESRVPYLVADADSSQFSALVDIANGKNLAVEGPPGTGKSQTIVNAIAAALADGKKVLFVAEKLAALNVVRSRLEAVGLGEFLLPLQAGRSTREQVIASVRTRVEMPGTPRVRHYEKHLTEFRRVRAELADYINLMTLHFEESGLTVHDILGKSIATDPHLSAVPSEILEKSDIPPTFLCVDGLAQLRSIAEAVECEFEKVSKASKTWKSTQLTHADRFTIDEICNLAAQASKSFQSLAGLRSGLESSGLEPRLSKDDLGIIAQSLQGAQALPPAATPSLLIALLEETKVQTLGEFLRDCTTCQAASAGLVEVLASDINQRTFELLQQAAAICSKVRFETLDITQLEQTRGKTRQALDGARAALSAIKPFVEARPEAASWRLSDISIAREAVLGAGRDALACRNPATTHPAAVQLLKQLCAEGRQLQAMKTRLGAKVSLAVEASVEELISALGVLRSSGTFSFLSADYRKAKQLARSLILAERQDKSEWLAGLEELIKFRKKEREFLRNPQTVTLFGLHFRGLDTDFALFERLGNFLETARATFAAPDKHPLKKFILEGELEELELLAAMSVTKLNISYKALWHDVERGEIALQHIENGISSLRPCLEALRQPASVAPKDLADIAAQTKQVLELQTKLSGNACVKNLLGGMFHEWRTDIASLQALHRWAAATLAHANTVAMILNSEMVAEASEEISRVLEAFERSEQIMDRLTKTAKLNLDHFTSRRTDVEIAEFLEKAAVDRDGLFCHSAFATSTVELQSTGAASLLQHRMEVHENLEGFADQLEAIAIRKLARAVYSKHREILSKYNGTKLDGLRSALAEHDREIIRLSREQLRSTLFSVARPPQGNGVGRKSEYTEMALIENEIGKKKRHVSVRDLTKRAGQALLALKPCWMMSPLAVAQYAPKGTLEFDLCIIDEASQMPPEAAIGALLRSKQTVVVGDTNQLPPSSFFKKMIDDEEADEDETVLNESILEMANATFRPARRLRWHYRSRHSGLIKFSNRLVYDDDLVVFPSATESMSRMGVEFRAIEGLYKGGTNTVEARAMVDAALEFMRNDPERSLGIVTLNQKQRDLIEQELDYAISGDPQALAYIEAWKQRNDGLEEFFIKNLENVQGDERDVIFIGTVYGRESKNSRVAQRFGPINGLAGKRRLNVLFSRAKEKIITFSSMTAADIIADEHGNTGAYMLKRWLEYSATGVLDGGIVTHRQPDSDFEVFVINQIKAMGCEPVPQVGVAGYFIDIGVKHPNWPHGFILGVECDGASYHSAKSARDRDRLRQEILEGLGWRFHRIWSTDWFNNPQREAERLRSVIEARMQELRSRETEFSSEPSVVESEMTVSSSGDQLDAEAALESLKQIAAANREASPEASKQAPRIVSVGDTVRVRYLTGDQSLLQVTIIHGETDLKQGVVNLNAPLAKALLEAQEGEEIEVLIGSYVRPAIIETIMRRAA